MRKSYIVLILGVLFFSCSGDDAEKQGGEGGEDGSWGSKSPAEQFASPESAMKTIEGVWRYVSKIVTTGQVLDSIGFDESYDYTKIRNTRLVIKGNTCELVTTYQLNEGRIKKCTFGVTHREGMQDYNMLVCDPYFWVWTGGGSGSYIDEEVVIDRRSNDTLVIRSLDYGKKGIDLLTTMVRAE